MHTELLGEIAGHRLPSLFYRPKDIKNARALCEAGSVIAVFSDRDGYVEIPYAQVLAITEKGQSRLAGGEETTLPVPRARLDPLAFLR